MIAAVGIALTTSDLLPQLADPSCLTDIPAHYVAIEEVGRPSYQLKISSNALALEQLTRPLLRLLSQVTGMESAYLTIIDSDRGRQYVCVE